MSKYCHSMDDVPKGDHFAIIEFDSIYIEGDERSKQCPGHGYPASTEPICRYIAFTDQAEWEREIGERVKRKSQYIQENFVAIRSRAVVVDVKVVVKVD